MDAKVKDYLELQTWYDDLSKEHKKVNDDYLERLHKLASAISAKEAEIIAEMEADGCLSSDYDDGGFKLTRVAVTVREQSPKPQSIDAVPDEYIVTKEVKSVNQAKIKADFMKAKILPNWLKRDEPVKSIAIRYVNKG